MIECPNCNTNNRPVARFCAQCGYKFPVGETLGGQYLVTRMLKVGGMGAVYEVECEGRRYALKEMRDRFVSPKERQEAVNRFLAEAITLARLSHPRIPRVQRHFIEGDRYYLAMDFVEGQDLADVLAAAPEGRFPAVEVIAWGQQICEVLDYLHCQPQPIIFRDLKPANLMLTPNRGLMLIDFGIARLFNPAQKSGVSLVGTPGYAAPEQYRGVAEPRSDLYALGATLHHLLTGADPADTSQHLFNFAPLRQHRPELSPELERVIERALAMKAEDRFDSAAEMGGALRSLISAGPAAVKGGGTVAGSGDDVSTIPSGLDWAKSTLNQLKILRRPVWRWSALIALGLLVAGFALFLTWQPLAREDDSRLAFVSNRIGNPEIYLLDPSSQIKPLTVDPAADDYPAWSPDKTHLAFASNRSGQWDIYQINADGSNLVRFTSHFADDFEPAWSPDGRYIAFTSTRDGKREIYLAGSEGISRMTHTPGAGESWQPAWVSSNIFLFTSTRDGKREIYHTTPSGQIERITYTPGQAESWSPHWNATTGYTVFVSNRDGQPEIYTLSPDGQLQCFTNTSAKKSSDQPTISPSGTMIAFTSDREGGREIYILTPTGTQRLTQTSGGESWAPAW